MYFFHFQNHPLVVRQITSFFLSDEKKNLFCFCFHVWTGKKRRSGCFHSRLIITVNWFSISKIESTMTVEFITYGMSCLVGSYSMKDIRICTIVYKLYWNWNNCPRQIVRYPKIKKQEKIFFVLQSRLDK